MNEVDVEKSRLNSRITTTWFVFMLGTIIAIFVASEIFLLFVDDIDIRVILIPIIGITIASKFEPRIRSFYEKRFWNNKKRSHTT